MAEETRTNKPGARLRFVPKRLGEGRSAFWRVYDVQNGSFPYTTPELGAVAQDFPGDKNGEAAAHAEADRLTAAHGGISEKAMKRGSKNPISGSYDPDEED